MRNTRWLDPSQPQTLQYAVLLLYLNAAFALLFSFGRITPGFPIVLAGVAGGWGIANERKWGYTVALGVAFLPFVLNLIFLHRLLAGDIITIAFEVLLVGLLLHHQSREYQRIWFK
jgi:hypothetical protein